jgi:hypothetical protein
MEVSAMPFVIEACNQPECLLWEEGFDCRSLAGLAVRVFSGGDVSSVMAGKSPIQPQEHCVDCVLRVMRGGRPGVEEYVRVGPSPRLRSPRRTREMILAHWQD